MTVEISESRSAKVITWDADKVGLETETVTIHTENPETGVPHTRSADNKKNDDGLGEAPIFYPLDYHGETDVTVEGSQGSDSGRITV